LSLLWVLYKFKISMQICLITCTSHRDCGYRAYTVISVDDLYNPFASMYFGASYLAWLSHYEGRSVKLMKSYSHFTGSMNCCFTKIWCILCSGNKVMNSLFKLTSGDQRMLTFRRLVLFGTNSWTH
jgi:hypothetical protein